MTVRIPSPCHEDWSRMAPNERGRHCASCDKTVVDVTRMGPEQGAKYLRRLPADLAAGAKVCVHAHADARGRLLSPVTRRLLTNGLATVLAMTIAGCNGHGPEVQNPPNQQQSQIRNQPQNQQSTQPSPQQLRTTGEPVAAMPGGVTCDPPAQVTTRGDVAVTPQSQTPLPVIEGEAIAPHVPSPMILVSGQVAAPQAAPTLPVIEGKVAATPMEVIKGKPVAPPVAAQPMTGSPAPE